MNPPRFQVQLRQEPHSGEPNVASWNLFARLDLSVVKDLYRDAARQATTERCDNVVSSSGWTVEGKQAISSAAVDFLPLEITFSSGAKAYVSYNGGNIVKNCRRNQETNDVDVNLGKNDRNSSKVAARNGDLQLIELPSCILPKEFQQQGQQTVFVRPLPNVRDAVEIHLEPLSVAAWELLEDDAQFLEDGGLLEQVSLVYPNQILPLRVNARDVAHARVLPFVGDETFNMVPCLRLMADTEVVVSPPPNSANSTMHRGGRYETLTLRVIPTWMDYSNPMRSLADRVGVTLVRPDESKRLGYVHPNTIRRLKGFATDNTTDNEEDGFVQTDDDYLAWVETVQPESNKGMITCQVVRLVAVTEGIPPDHVGFHPLIGLALKTTPLVSKVTLRLLHSSEIAIGPIELTEKIEYGHIKYGHIKLSVFPFKINTSRYNKPWRVTSNSLGRDQSPPFSHCEMVWQPKSCQFELFSDSLEDNPLASGAVLSVTVDGVSCNHSLLCVRYEPREDHLQTSNSNVRPCFLILRDLVDLLNQNSDAMEVMKALCLEVCEMDKVGVTKQMITPEAHYNLNMLPPTWFCPPFVKLDTDTPCHTAITGPSGSGRSFLALMLAAQTRLCFRSSTHYLDCNSLKFSPDLKMKDLLNELTEVFQEALRSTPATVILDNLEKIAPNLAMDDVGHESVSSQNYRQVNPTTVDQAKLIADHIGQLVKEACVSSDGVICVITCSDFEQVAPSITTLVPWDRLSTPLKLNPEVRREMFSAMLQSFYGTSVTNLVPAFPFTPNFDRMTEGFRAIDLESVARRLSRSIHRDHAFANTKNFEFATMKVLHEYMPVARQSVVTEDASTSLSWAEVGGLFNVKASLTDAILHPIKYRRIYERSPIKLPRGIMLFGPPGCGKSILVPALAKECGFRLVTCRGPELLDKYIGASEAKVRDLFARAKAASPCILFLDEFDALAPRRGSDHTGVTDRVVNQLLTFLDGVEDALDDMMYIIAATSRPDKVDPALLRPGRLEKHFYVGLPETEREWMDLLARIASKWTLDDSSLQAIARGDLDNIIGESSVETSQAMQLSGADMKAVFDTAYIQAVHNCLKQGRSDPSITIQLEHLQSSFQTIRPSLSASDRKLLMDVYRPFLETNQLRTYDQSQPTEMRLRTTLR